MKRILCILLAILTVVPFFTFSVSAADDTPSVMQELAQLSIDGKQFKESDYPFVGGDESITVLTVVESGFVNSFNSPDFNLYFYIYSPGGIDFKELPVAKVVMGLNDQCEESGENGYLPFGLKVMSRSSDNRFWKFKITDYADSEISGGVSAEDAYRKQTSAIKRIYNVVDIYFENVTGVVHYETVVDKAFIFQGYDSTKTLKCISQTLGALDVELHNTNWISPNADINVDTGGSASIYDHYEINSVYFTLPKSLFRADGQAFEGIRSIRADYWAYKTTPMLVTKPNVLKDVTKNAIFDAAYIDSESDAGIDNLISFSSNYSLPWYYTENAWVSGKLDGIFGQGIYERKYQLAYLFETLDSDFVFEDGKVSDIAISEERLKNYLSGKTLTSPYVDESFTKHMTMDYSAEEFGTNYLWNMEMWTAGMSDTEYWWRKLCYGSDSYLFQNFDIEVETIKFISNPLEYATLTKAQYEEVANELIMGVNDMGEFSTVCKNAAANDEVVVLLRFGFSNFSCAPLSKIPTVVGVQEQVGYSIEKWIYQNVDLCHIVFAKNDQSYVIPVVSEAIDAYGDSPVFDLPGSGNVGDSNNDRNLWEEILQILTFVVFLLGIIAVFLIFAWLVGLLGKFIGGSAKASEAVVKKQRERSKGKRKDKSDDGGGPLRKD